MSSGSGYNSNQSLRKKPRGLNVGSSRRGAGRPMTDKSVLQEGIYVNERFLHMIASLVGCTAQIKVKNGRIYEGILRTSSPKFEIVLERAHLVDQSCDGKIGPSHEEIIPTVIFNRSDIVTLTFSDVNLDYAVIDGFTDGAISGKCNGQAREKELQPWVSDQSSDDHTLQSIEDSNCELDNEKGWDPNEMFATNTKKFNIKSDYDPSLSQYTTPLLKTDTAEFREREERAEQLAMEIERGTDHGARAALENGDNEEMAFSAVQRPGSAVASELSAQRGSSTTGKYVAPHMRNSQLYSSNSNSTSAQRPQHLAGGGSVPVSAGPGSATSAGAATVVSKSQVEAVSELDHAETRVNGNDERVGEMQQSPHEPREKRETVATGNVVTQQQPSVASKPSTTKGAEIDDLKQFHTSFKLSDRERQSSTAQVPVVDNPPVPQPHVAVSSLHDSEHQLAAVPAEKPHQVQQLQPVSSEVQDSATEVLKKSVLNPNAKEFNPTLKSVPARVVPSTTPPRPVSVPQSPVSTYSTPVAATQMPPPSMYAQQQVFVNVQQPSQGPRFQVTQPNKRVTVSARNASELNQTPQATIMTGAPLITAQPMMQIGQPGMFQPQFIPVHPSQANPYQQTFQVPLQLMMRPTLVQMGQDPGQVSGLQQIVATSQPGNVFLSHQPVVHIAHPSMQPHVAPATGAPLTSQQTQSAGAPSGVQHPPVSGHQTPTPSQLQPPYPMQSVVLPAAASGTPQSGPPHGAGYHPMAPQHQPGVMPHQVVVQQQNVGAQSVPAPQSPQVAYTSGPVPLHYTAHQGLMAFVPAASQTAQMQQPHTISAASLSQQSSVSSGTSTVQMTPVQHPPPSSHLMMTTQQPQPGAASQHAMHAQQMPPLQAGPTVATPMILSGQPPQPGGPAGVGGGPPGAHQYVQAHPIPGAAAVAQGHLSVQTAQHMMGMFAMPHHSIHQGPPQVQNFQHGGPQQ